MFGNETPERRKPVRGHGGGRHLPFAQPRSKLGTGERGLAAAYLRPFHRQTWTAGVNSGVYRSANQEQNWEAVNSGLTQRDVYSLVVSGTTGTLGQVGEITVNAHADKILTFTPIEEMKASGGVLIEQNREKIEAPVS